VSSLAGQHKVGEAITVNIARGNGDGGTGDTICRCTGEGPISLLQQHLGGIASLGRHHQVQAPIPIGVPHRDVRWPPGDWVVTGSEPQGKVGILPHHYLDDMDHIGGAIRNNDLKCSIGIYVQGLQCCGVVKVPW